MAEFNRLGSLQFPLLKSQQPFLTPVFNFQRGTKLGTSVSREGHPKHPISLLPHITAGRPDPMSTLVPAASIAARGSGGRSSVSGVTAAVFGSTGFLGRYVVNHLGKIGSQVSAPYRGDELNSRHLRPMGDLGQVVPVPFDLRDEDSISDAMKGMDVVVNLMGKHYETHNFSYDDVHRGGAAKLAQLAKENHVRHFVHVSALGADSTATRSRWLASKAAGELEVRSVYPEATIVRPATMWGMEDRFLTRMANEISKLPAVPIAGLGNAKTQPVWVNDVASVVVAATRDPELYGGKTFELAGPDVLTIEECYQFVVEHTKREQTFIHLPGRIAEVAAFAMHMRLPVLNPDPPHSHDLVRLELEEKSVLDENKKGVVRFDDLDAIALSMHSDIAKGCLRSFRKGGDRSSLFYVD